MDGNRIRRGSFIWGQYGEFPLIGQVAGIWFTYSDELYGGRSGQQMSFCRSNGTHEGVPQNDIAYKPIVALLRARRRHKTKIPGNNPRDNWDGRMKVTVECSHAGGGLSCKQYLQVVFTVGINCTGLSCDRHQLVSFALTVLMKPCCMHNGTVMLWKTYSHPSWQNTHEQQLKANLCALGRVAS